MNNYVVYEMSDDDLVDTSRMMVKLWPDTNQEDELQTCRQILLSTHETCFVAREGQHKVGFAQFSIRNEFVEGATNYPVLYLEGIYVSPDVRRSGVGRSLCHSGELWGKNRGCLCMASDAEIENTESIEFHKAIGLDEVNRIICYHKVLKPARL